MGERSKRGSERPISGFQNSAPQKLDGFGALGLDPENSARSADAKELDLTLLVFKHSKKQSLYVFCVEESGKLPESLLFLQQKENDQVSSSF